jgi:pimeloyl-ACP methyl ester carboxylesterase
MSYADVNGISLYYEEHGSGQPLVLLHGGYGSGEMYAPILESLARLAILPSHTHYDIFGSPDLASVVIPFLDVPSLDPPAPTVG